MHICTDIQAYIYSKRSEPGRGGHTEGDTRSLHCFCVFHRQKYGKDFLCLLLDIFIVDSVHMKRGVKPLLIGLIRGLGSNGC